MEQRLADDDYYLGYVIYTTAGTLIFDKYIEEMKMDTQLLAGMLTALQHVAKEITDTRLDKFEFHKFNIYLISSDKYELSHGIITNGAYKKNHAFE